ncbi:MAG: SusD/RagB family nutrient-binding outer membrane lipoprotein [Bacteroidales bacterium]|nr:SusD/RagB family nutrient-binding outer membrane lipoprotein [Bacteroidales bacterium]
MKSKFLILFAAVGLFFISSSCKDYLDVNHSMSAIEKLDAQRALPSAQIIIANQLMGWDMGIGSAVWVQYWTQAYNSSQYKALCSYSEFEWGTAYRDLCAGALADLGFIQRETADDKDNQGLWYIAEALSIYTWQVITDVWGDMPYFEAMKGNEGLVHPKFDTQESIYADLMVRIDNLVKMDISKMVVDPKFDFVFAGDMPQWQRFCNSLKLKLMLRLSETPGFDIAALAAFVDDAIGKDLLLLDKNAEIAGTTWNPKEVSKKHPLHEVQSDGANFISLNVIACKSFTDFLVQENDPRIDKFFDGTLGAFAGDYDSKDDSDGNGKNDKDESWAKVNYSTLETLPIPFISAWQMNFDVAEVLVRAGRTAEAQAYYEAGVKASCAAWGVDASAMLSSTDPQAKTPWKAEEALERIGLQRWVAFAYLQNLEAFLERNRTKFPSVNTIDVELNRQDAWTNFPVGQLTISVQGRAKLGGELPHSLLYPQTLRTRNNNAIPQKKNVGDKVWWDKKSGL